MIKSTDSVVKISDKNSGIELELGLRPVAIDCANLACFYDYCRPIGSAIGPLEAYRYFKSRGHVTKVFIHQFRLCNKREGKRMRDVEFLLDGIPEYDRPLVPSGSDDDAFVIQWAIENNAIIGGNSAVQQFTRVGKSAMIGGMCGVVRDIIPYGIAHGNRSVLQGLNLIGLRRKNIPNKEIIALNDAYKEIFKNENLTENLSKLSKDLKNNKLVAEVIEFIEKDKKRPICTPFSK